MRGLNQRFRQAGGNLEAAVQIDRPQHRLQGISQEGGFLPATLSFFSPPQQEVGPQIQAPGQGRQLPGIYQGGSPPGHLPFGTFGKPGQEQGADGEGQDRVPQELQPFIAGAAPRVIMGIGTVAQGLVQQPEVPEAVLQPQGQALQFLPPGGGQFRRSGPHQPDAPRHRQGIPLVALIAICLPLFSEK